MLDNDHNYNDESSNCFPRLIGFHHDYLGKIEKSGLVQVKNIKRGLHGSYMADIIVKGIYGERKAFFPRLWTHEKVMEKILESIQGPNKIFRKVGNVSIIEGFTREGMEIRSVITESGKITLSYPIGFSNELS